MKATIIGIDPGLVDTGVVIMNLEHEAQRAHWNWDVDFEVFDAARRVNLPAWIKTYQGAHVFVEAYRPRGNNYGEDPKMRELMSWLKQELPKAKVLDNTGVKQVVLPDLMKLLRVWDFPKTTHHQDLRSAARIGLLGAMKDPALNEPLYYIVNSLINYYNHNPQERTS